MELIAGITYYGDDEEEVPKFAQNIVIHSSVECIPKEAFRGCNSLESIIIPSSVKTIGPGAFRECKMLERIEIPFSVETICDAAFYGCTALVSIDLPESVTTIGTGAFLGCTNLTSVIIPSSVTNIEPYTFQGCISLAKVEIPDSVKAIGRNAFCQCKGIRFILLPKSVTSIGELAFSECLNAEWLEILGSAVTIDKGAFSRCSALSSAVLPQVLTTITTGAFADCTSLTSIVIPNSVTSICSYAFHGCAALSQIEVPNSVMHIDQSAFNGCVALEAVVLPEGLTIIAPYTWYGCTSLKSIVIPKKVESIGDYAFQGCVSLNEITIPNAVASIGRNAFCRCSSLKSISIPFTVTTIRQLTFSQCSSLATVTIPSSVNVIGESAFEGCSKLAAVELPESITTISWGAFAACATLATVLIPPFVATICNFAFAECESLTSVMIPDSVTSIGETAFEGCPSLSLIAIPSSVKTIGHRAFAECPLLERGSASVSDGVTAWLRVRFNSLPLHALCQRIDISRSMIVLCLEKYPESARSHDSLGISALHVLLLNDNVKADMVEDLIEVHPEALQEIGPLGRYPLHLACLSPNVPTTVVKLLSSSYTKNGRLALTVKDDNNDVPCALALRYSKYDESVFHLFERYPIRASTLRTPREKRRHYRICECYIENLSRETLSSIRGFHPLQRHGWVEFVMIVEDQPSLAQKCIGLIEKLPVEIVKTLANFKDLNGHLAIDNASKAIKAALERRLENSVPFSEPSVCGSGTNKNDSSSHNDLKSGSLAKERPRSICQKRFRKLLQRLKINLNGADEVDRRMSQSACLEVYKGVLDNVQFKHYATALVKHALLFRWQMRFSYNIRLDSSYHFGAKYQFHQYVGRVAFDALMSFSVDNGLHKDSEAFDLCSYPAQWVSRSTPICVREFSRQLLEAIARAPLYNKRLVNIDDAIKSLVLISSRSSSNSTLATVPESKTSTNDFDHDSGSDPSLREGKPIFTFTIEIDDQGLGDSMKFEQTDENQATFLAVKTYLSEQVLNSEQGVVQVGSRKRLSSTTNKAFRIIRRFCPNIPKNCIPQTLLNKVELFVSRTSPRGKAPHPLTKKTPMEEKDLLEFLTFLREKDETGSQSSQRRVKHRMSRKSVWMSSAKKLHSIFSDEVRISTFLRLNSTSARTFGPLLHPPSFLLHFVFPSLSGSTNSSFDFLLRRSHRCCVSRGAPFTNPLFPLPAFHRKIWQDLLHLRPSVVVSWYPPHRPFLFPLFQLPSLRLRSWEDLLDHRMLSNPHQQFLRPLLSQLAFREQE